MPRPDKIRNEYSDLDKESERKKLLDRFWLTWGNVKQIGFTGSGQVPAVCCCEMAMNLWLHEKRRISWLLWDFIRDRRSISEVAEVFETSRSGQHQRKPAVLNSYGLNLQTLEQMQSFAPRSGTYIHHNADPNSLRRWRRVHGQISFH